MFSVWNRYDVSSQLGFGLGVIYQDEQFASASNAVSVPDFTRVDAGVFYTMRNGTVLQLNIENLLDEDYFPAAHNNNNISPGAPLNARFSVKTRF
jgi:catecholate siderophore receptor